MVSVFDAVYEWIIVQSLVAAAEYYGFYGSRSPFLSSDWLVVVRYMAETATVTLE